MIKKAVVLNSGGLDSATVLAIAKSEGFELYVVTFDYGQAHASEIQSAKRLAKQFDVKQHKVIKLPVGEFGGSALTDEKISVPDYQGGVDIPATYVPARNTVFFSLALSWAEALGAHDIFVGVSAVDYSGYPDCRPEYIKAFQAMANLATKTGVEGKPIVFHAPLIHLSKAQTIQRGVELGVDYSQTVSCYRADEQGRACGCCDSCVLRQHGFQEAGIPDLTVYAA